MEQELAQKVCGGTITLDDYEIVTKIKEGRTHVYCNNKLNRGKRVIVTYSTVNNLLHGKCCLYIGHVYTENSVAIWIDDPKIILTKIITVGFYMVNARIHVRIITLKLSLLTDS